MSHPDPPRIRSTLVWARRVFKDSRSRAIATLTAGGTAASLLGLGVLPLITHQYQPSTYATFALVFTATAVLSTVVTGKYEQAIPLQQGHIDGDRRSFRLAALSLLTAGLICALGQAIVIIVYLLVQPSGEEGQALLATPLLVWLSTLVTIQTQLLTRAGQYASIAVFQLVRSGLQLGVQIGLGFVNPSVGALLAGFAVSLLPQAGHCLWLLRKSLVLPVGVLLELAKRERHLPLYQAPTALIRALETNVALFVLAATYGDSLVAMYALALRIVVSPATLVASAANTVYLREAPRLVMSRHYKLYGSLSAGLATLGLLGTMFLVILADPVSSLLGSGWEQAGAAIRATAPLAVAVFLGAIPSSTLLVEGHHHRLLWSRGLIMAVPNAVVVLAFVAAVPGILALLGYSLSMLTCVLALNFGVARYLTSQKRRLGSAEESHKAIPARIDEV